MMASVVQQTAASGSQVRAVCMRHFLSCCSIANFTCPACRPPPDTLSNCQHPHSPTRNHWPRPTHQHAADCVPRENCHRQDSHPSASFVSHECDPRHLSRCQAPPVEIRPTLSGAGADPLTALRCVSSSLQPTRRWGSSPALQLRQALPLKQPPPLPCCCTRWDATCLLIIHFPTLQIP